MYNHLAIAHLVGTKATYPDPYTRSMSSDTQHNTALTTRLKE